MSSGLALLYVVAIFVIPFVVTILTIMLGEMMGRHHVKRYGTLDEGSISTVVGAAMALLAFLLAFTFQIVSDRLDTRRELLLDDVTNIRTTSLRAGLLPEPYRTRSRTLLKEYVNLRVELAGDVTKTYAVISRSHAIADSLWKYSEELSALDRSSESYSLYISSTNDLIEILNKRITMSLEYRIPETILWVLFAISTSTMLGLGFQFGAKGTGSMKLYIFWSVVFACVVWLILVLDRPETGMVRLSQEAVFRLQEELR
ncbi:MAG TPA: hypothetical protein VK147_01740 [Candidatus Didemnitutus sp.]|nr:hypothetical protein [Candidatus Didemnitutus sp.]